MYILTDGLPILIILINIKLFRGTYVAHILTYFERTLQPFLAYKPYKLYSILKYWLIGNT